MAQILCLDTEPETIQALTELGHKVAVGNLGYRTGTHHQPNPPHEFEAVVCDLRRPACYDALHWGPGGNSNFQCEIVERPSDETHMNSGQRVPRYQLVHGKQIKALPGINFDGHDVLNAVIRAGTHVFLMFNPEWAKHLSWSFPNLAGVNWSVGKTVANRVALRRPLEILLGDANDELRLQLPLKFSMLAATARQGALKEALEVVPLAVNSVDQTFAQLIKTAKGSIWILPRFQHNALALSKALMSLGSIPRIFTECFGIDNTSVRAAQVQSETRDVFISHAWEDKEFARPLAQSLLAEGITVWFDEYELKLGDSLRQKIEDGLKRSQNGLVIMSRNFFRKAWPQKELDALFALENEERRILPIWHGVDADQVKKLAPLLADRLAISTDRGMPAIVAEVKRALGR